MLNILPASHAATGSIVVNTPAMDAAVPSRGGIVVSWANHQDEVRAAQRLRFETVRDDLEQVLAQNSFAEELGKYIKELRNDAKIQIFAAETGKN